MGIGSRIKRVRKEKRFTQNELAKKVNVSSQVISNWERGYTDPDHDDVARLSEALECTSDYLLGRTSHPTLTVELEKEVDEEVDELWEIIDSLPEEEREETIKQVLAYAKFLADANKTRD